VGVLRAARFPRSGTSCRALRNDVPQGSSRCRPADRLKAAANPHKDPPEINLQPVMDGIKPPRLLGARIKPDRLSISPASGSRRNLRLCLPSMHASHPPSSSPHTSNARTPRPSIARLRISRLLRALGSTRQPPDIADQQGLKPQPVLLSLAGTQRID
jgi:hypothetical protein